MERRRSRSPGRKERRQSPPRSRDKTDKYGRDRRDTEKEKRRDYDRDYDRRRERSRSRSPRRRDKDRDSYRERDRDRDRDRDKERDRDRERDKERGPESSQKSSKKSRKSSDQSDRKGDSYNPDDSSGDEVMVDRGEDEAMMKLMGFSGFDTTKNKRVKGNIDGSVKLMKPRKYRQYMNRRGGFNRPLDYVT